MSTDNNRSKGKRYEEIALNYLLKEGHTVLERNYLRKTGEIDLITESPEGIIVFTEVKYRKSLRSGYPEEAVTPGKQRKIYKTAEWYLRENRISPNRKFRFDVIGILDKQVKHIQNAFGAFG